MASFRFTAHAIERYLDRIDRNANPTVALRVLYRACATAYPAAERSPLGDPMYLVDDPPMRWIVKHELREIVVVTIVRGHAAPDYAALREAEEEVLDAHRRAEPVLTPHAVSKRRDVTSPVGEVPTAPRGRAAAQWASVETARAAENRERLRLVRVALTRLPQPSPSVRGSDRTSECALAVLRHLNYCSVAAGW